MTPTTPSAEALAACPFCGTAAHFFKIDDPDSRDFGGEGICCQTTACASIGLMWSVMDDCKPLLAEKWNRRASLASEPKAQAQAAPVDSALRDIAEEIVAGKIELADMTPAGLRRLAQAAILGLAPSQAQAAEHSEPVTKEWCAAHPASAAYIINRLAAQIDATPPPAARETAEPVLWQWRRKRDPWTLEHTYNTPVIATTDDSEVRMLYAAPVSPSTPPAQEAAQPVTGRPQVFSPEYVEFRQAEAEAHAQPKAQAGRLQDHPERLAEIEQLCSTPEATRAFLVTHGFLNADGSTPAKYGGAELSLGDIALEECLQLGYTVADGRLNPPESLEWQALAASRLQAKGLLRG